MATKKGTKRGAKKSSAPRTNGAKRHFIQVDVGEKLREDVDSFLDDKGFTAANISISQIGRVMYESMTRGLPVQIRNVADYHRAQAALAEG